jgi:hypothetical protein
MGVRKTGLLKDVECNPMNDTGLDSNNIHVMKMSGNFFYDRQQVHADGR